MPISVYSIVQTIGKSMAGGERGGVIIVEYKSIFPLVIRADNAPVVKAIAIEII